jgi:hypothetical protein
MLMEIDGAEIERNADASGNRVMLCTEVGGERIQKMDVDIEKLFSREAGLN